MPLSQFAQLSAQFAQIAEAYAKARQENKDLKEQFDELRKHSAGIASKNREILAQILVLTERHPSQSSSLISEEIQKMAKFNEKLLPEFLDKEGK